MSSPLSLAVFQDHLQSCLAQSGSSQSLASVGFVVALSGGLDSTVLLELCRQLRERGEITRLRAVHVHHGLSGLADGWVDHVSGLCEQWQVPLAVHYVSCNGQQSVEESARAARYQAFEQELAEGESLLQGHHRDDQVETLLYRLVRGTGVDGMRGIPRQRRLGAGLLLRPLLAFARSGIEVWANAQGLCWIEDDSNGDTRFDRNFLRTEIVPKLQTRWPGCAANIIRFADHCDDTGELLTELAQQDFRRLSRPMPLVGRQSTVALDCQGLLALSRARQNLLLRYWLQERSVSIPSQEMLRRIVGEVAEARVDAGPVVAWADFVVRRHQGQLLVGRELPEAGMPLVSGDGRLVTMAGNGQIVVRSADAGGHAGDGLAIRAVQGEWSLRQGLVAAPFALPGRRGQKPLKKWLHELGIAPWLRGRLPVLHRGEQLIAIPGILVAEGWQANGLSSGWILEWEMVPVGDL